MKRFWFKILLGLIAILAAFANVYGDHKPTVLLPDFSVFQSAGIILVIFFFPAILLSLLGFLVKVIFGITSVVSRCANPRVKLKHRIVFNGWIEKYSGFIALAIGCGTIASSPWTGFSTFLDGCMGVSFGSGIILGFALARRIVGEHAAENSQCL